jgi:hypothetical protein
MELSVTLENVPLSLFEFRWTISIFCPGCNTLRFVHDDLSARAKDTHGIAKTHSAIASDLIV